MSLLPQVNCTLFLIGDHNSGMAEDYRRDADPPTPKWQGESGAFVDERIVSKFNRGGELNREERVTLYVDADLPVLRPVVSGDLVSYHYEGIDYSAKIARKSTPRLAGAPSYSTLELEDVSGP